jgi:acetylornithine deacetylase/succinyl-diaminopimelate desuccinylase-like protein
MSTLKGAFSSMQMLDLMLHEADGARGEVLDLAKELVRLDTTNTGAPDSGNETLVAEFLARHLRRAGVRDIRLLGRTSTRQNIIATQRGAVRRVGMLLMCHSDVVPPGERALWRTDPFSPTVRNGRLYGRGAADMKGTVAAMTTAFVLAHRLRLSHRESVRLICGADEEAGGVYGFGWLLARHPSLLNARFAFNEGGGRPHRTKAGPHYGLAWGEKGRYEAHLTFAGVGAHAAMPWRGTNALARAAAFVRRVTETPPAPTVDARLLRGFRALVGSIPAEPKRLEAFLAGLSSRNEPLATELRALTRMTCTPTIVSGGVKSNSVPDRVEVTCDIRTLPRHTRAHILRYLKASTEGLGATIDLRTTAEPSATTPRPGDTDFVGLALAAALGTPVEVFPSLTVGFTDSRFARQTGTRVVGFAPRRPAGAAEPERAHGANESLHVEDLYLQTRFYAAALAMAAERLP